MRKITTLFSVLMLICTLAVAQTRTVTGTIKDDKDQPISGASVIIKGKKGGTVTNASGTFSISAETGNTLIISAVGFSSKEIKVDNASNYSVSLVQQATDLGEVIVTSVAAATTKAKLTVSVTKLNANAINAVPQISLSSALSGKVAGVKVASTGGLPGQDMDIQLRADNNLNVGSGPLILVDGVQISGSLADINSDDVESIEVVKGAAASALYGSRAGNGVIAVITKRGKGSGMSVVVRNEIGFQTLSHTLKVATHNPYSLAADWQNFKGQYTKYAGVTYPSGYSGTGFDPGISGNRTVKADHYMDSPYGIERNPQKDVFGTGINYTNFVSISSKSEKTAVYASFENNSQEGVVALTDGYRRRNFRLNLDQQVTKWLKLSTTNLVINRYIQYPGGSPFYNVARLETDINLNQVNPVDGQPYYPRIDQWIGEIVNPLYTLWKQKRNDKDRRWLANYTANVKFTNWANLDLSHTLEIENYRSSVINPKDTWKVSGPANVNNGMTYTDGSLSMSSSENNTQNTQLTLNMAHRFFGDLNVAGKLSYLYENNHYESFSVNSSQFVVNGIEAFNNFASINGAGSYISEERAQNVFAIASLDYKDRYLLDGMYRYDGSSLFGSDARWNPYYRLSGAYRISKDVTIPGIQELKIRAAHGTAGIRPGFDWQYEVYGLSNGIASPSQKGNKLLKPSKTSETEVGLDVNFLKKFTFEATYSFSNTTDQFLNAPLIPFLNDGYSSQWVNAGNVKANTFEATLGAKWVQNKDFSWTSNIVFSRTRQKVGDLPIPPYYLGAYTGDVNVFYISPNSVYGAMYGYRFVRTLDDMSRQLPAGKTIADYEVNSDGYVIAKGTQGTPAERPIRYQEKGADWFGIIGDGNANFNVGLTNTVQWKGFTLYFLLDWKQGGEIYNANNQRMAFNNMYYKMDMANVPAAQKKAYDYWFSGMYDANLPNKYWVEDASYLKVREFALGYTLNSKALDKAFHGVVKGVNLKVVGRNLLTFTKYSGYDPEVGSIRQPIDGIGANPNYRNIAFSLSLNF